MVLFSETGITGGKVGGSCVGSRGYRMGNVFPWRDVEFEMPAGIWTISKKQFAIQC